MSTKKDVDTEQKEYERNLTKLWKILTDPKTSEEQKSSIVSQLNEKTLNALRTLKNPYKVPVFAKTEAKDKLLSFSVVNIQEKYYQRFAVTSLIAFLFRMLDEYEHESVKDMIHEDSPEFQKYYRVHLAEYQKTKPLELLKNEISEMQKVIDVTEGEISDLTEDKNKEDDGDDSQEDENAIVERKDNIDKSIVEKTDLVKKTKNDVIMTKAKMIKFEQSFLSKDLKKAQIEKDKHTELINENERWKIAIKEKIAEDKKDLKLLALKEKEENTSADPDAANDSSEDKTSDSRADKKVKSKKSTKTLKDSKAKDVKQDDEKKERTKIEIESSMAHHRFLLGQAREKRTPLNEKSKEIDRNIDNINKRLSELSTELEELRKEYLASRSKKSTVKDLKSKNKSSKKDKKKVKNVEPDDPFEGITQYEFEPDEDDLGKIRQLAKREMGIEFTAEEQNELIQGFIEDFLMEHFCYNPDNHVQCAYRPYYEGELKDGKEIDRLRAAAEKEYAKSLIPPEDTFYRLQRYIDEHYEYLRQATDDIYDERSDLELTIIPYAIFEGKEAEEKCGEFERKYASEVENDMMRAWFGQHNFLAPFAQNREKVQFYTEKTELIKRIIKHSEENAKMGTKMTKKRADRKKAEEKKKHGDEPESFKDYLKSNPSKLGAAVERITAENIPKDEKDASNKEVEINVHNIKPVRRGRRIYGATDQWKFNVPAKALKEDQLKVQTASQFQKDLVKKEASKDKE